MEHLFTRTLSGLAPLDDAGMETLRRIPVGDVVRVEVKKLRNAKHHRLFFALVGLVHDNLPDAHRERIPSVEALVNILKCKTGWCDTYLMGNGQTVMVPRSIAFHAMDQIAFDHFFNRCCDVIAREWLPGVGSSDLRREAEQMLGMTRRAA